MKKYRDNYDNLLKDEEKSVLQAIFDGAKLVVGTDDDANRVVYLLAKDSDVRTIVKYEVFEKLCYNLYIIYLPHKKHYNITQRGIQCLLYNGTILAPHTHKMSRSEKVFAADGYMCVYCDSPENLTIDHIIPSAKGGSEAYSNLQTLCRRCNNKKGDKFPYTPPVRKLRKELKGGTFKPTHKGVTI